MDISINYIIITFLILTGIIFGRYLLLAGIYHKYIYRKIRSVKPQRILSFSWSASQIRAEIIWSGISTFIFAAVGLIMILAYRKGHTAIYHDIREWPIWYIPISIVAAMLIHETYYYWMHRWLHHPRIYRLVHKIHHESIQTTAWTSFSFHPIESLLQAVIIPVIIFIIPLHWTLVLFLLLVMTISAIINHAGVEIFPASWGHHPIMKWFIGATHHDLHHRKFTTNYGLYFSFWDHWMGTEDVEFKNRFVLSTRENYEQ